MALDLNPTAVSEKADAVRKTETPYTFDPAQSTDISGGVAFVGVSRKTPKNGAQPETVAGIQEGRMQRVAPLHAFYALVEAGVIPADAILSLIPADAIQEWVESQDSDDDDETPDA